MFKWKQSYYKIMFAVIYTGVMLPFSVAFFHHIASAPDGDKLLGIIPLSAAHNLMLPLFLAILEFASINLAFILWAKTERWQHKALIGALFLCCQLFPVISVYYDINAKEYSSLTSAMTDQREATNGRGDILKAQIADVSGEITQLLALGNHPRKVTALMNKKSTLYAELSTIQAAKASTVKQSELDFVRASVGTSKGFLPLGISILFPISILAFARIVKPEPRVAAEVVVRHKKAVKKKAVAKNIITEPIIA